MRSRKTADSDSGVPWPVVIAALTVIVFAACYLAVSRDIHTVISHLFYIPIVITAWFFPLAGIIYAAAIALGYLGLECFSSPSLMSSDVIYRSMMFILVGVIVSVLSRHLHRKEEMVREMIEQMRSGVLTVTRLQGRVVLANKYIRDILVPSSGVMTGRTLYEFARDDRELEKLLTECCDLEAFEGREIVLVSETGLEHYFHVTGREENSLHLLLTMQDLTLRRHMEEEMAVSRSLMQSLLDSIPEAVWLSDLDGIILKMNQTCLNLFPVSGDEKPVSVRSLFPVDWTGQITSEIREVIFSRDKREFATSSPSGKDEYEISIIPVFSSTGRVVQVTGIIRDITGQQRLIRKIQDQERFLRTILNGLPVACLVIDADHRVLYVNLAVSMLFEQEVDDLMGTRNHPLLLYPDRYRPLLADLMVGEDVDIALETYYEGKYSPSPTVPGAFEVIDFYPLVGPNGRWIRATAARIVDANGDIIGAIETFEDFNSQKEAQEAIRLREERFKLASHIATDLIFEYTLSTRTIAWFGDVDRRLGYSTGHLKESIDDWFLHVHDEDRLRLSTSFRFHETTGDPIEEEIRIRHRSGQYRIWIIKAVAMYDTGMQHTKTVGIVSDITGIRESEELKKKAVLAIEKNIQQFAILGDHIRNPLQAIAGYNDIQGGDFTGKIAIQIQKINEIVDQLDKGWIESESIREFLRRHYGVTAEEEEE